MLTNRYKASAALGLAVAGLLISTVFTDSFAGQLIASGCAAAVVGGVADWFAVNALFRRPLGIRFRTAVIPAKRERIFRDMVDLVTKRLLSPEHIKEKIRHYDMADLLFRYLDSEGRNELAAALPDVLRDFVVRLRPQVLTGAAAALLRAERAQVSIAPLISQALQWALRQRCEEPAGRLLLAEATVLIRHPQIQAMLTEVVATALARYERDMERRRVVLTVLKEAGFTPQRLAAEAQSRLLEYLRTMSEQPQPLQQWIRQEGERLEQRLRTDREFQDRINAWQRQVLTGQGGQRRFVHSLIRQIRREIMRNEHCFASLTEEIFRQLDQVVVRLRNEPAMRTKTDALLTMGFMSLVDQFHAGIAAIVRDKLGRFSDAELADFIEAKVGDDLQMIRINGSVVGGLAGILIFLLTSWCQYLFRG